MTQSDAIRRHEETCDQLGPFLSHPDPKVRELAEWAMRQSGAVLLVATSLEAVKGASNHACC